MRNPVAKGILFPLLIALLLTAGCGRPKQSAEGGYELRDARGRLVHIAKKPQRVLTLSIYTDEIVLGLLPSDRLVAVNRFLDDPKESVVVEKARKIPEKVGAPTVEQIMAWRPDIIFADPWTGEEKLAMLEDMRMTVVACGPSNSYEDIQNNIRLIAAGLDEKERGEEVIAAMDAVEREIAAKVARIPESERKSVVLLSVMTNYGGAGSAFDDMCRHAGVVNAAAAVGLRTGHTLTKELLVKSDPDFLLLPNYDDKGTFDTQKFIDGYLKDPSLQTMKAIRNRALYYPRESYIYNGSQDFVFGIQELAFCAYGDDFKQEDNRHISVSGEK